MSPLSRRRPLCVVLAGLLLAALLSACTGVPTSSAPQVIKTLPIRGPEQPNPIAPKPGESPENLVRDFISASELGDSKHSSARAFLTPAARNRWNDTTATVVDETRVGPYVAGKPIVVRGRVLGTLTASGVYTPTLQGPSAPLVQFPFEIARSAGGQYRITKLNNGVVLSQRQFQHAYRQPRNLFFFDLAQHYLVADPRWTSISDPGQLASWLMNQLAGGPNDLLANAVTSDTLPAQAATENITVTLGALTKIEIPGSSQLDHPARDRLATQVANTLKAAVPGGIFVITDGGTPVNVPNASGSQFTASDFGDTTVPALSPEVYYLRNGHVVDQTGRRLTGAISDTPYFLTSIAASRSDPGGALAVAGVASVANTPTLLVGSQIAGLRPTGVRGVTSRPAYAPDRDEVWVGAGPRIMRVTVSGRTVQAAPVALPASANGGQVIALRLSPEGARIAVALQDSAGHRRLFVGAVVRTGSQVRVDTLQPVSPAGAVIIDVAWVEPLRLYAIGYDTPSGDTRLYSTGVDGSDWNAQNIGSLPAPPNTLSITVGQPGWVTAGSWVWTQSVRGWVSPGPGGRTTGQAPTYLE